MDTSSIKFPWDNPYMTVDGNLEGPELVNSIFNKIAFQWGWYFGHKKPLDEAWKEYCEENPDIVSKYDIFEAFKEGVRHSVLLEN